MAANPTIKFVSATKDATSTLIMALLENTSRGMVQMRAYLNPTCVTEDVAMRTNWCVEQADNIYIPELYQSVNCYKTATTTVSGACLRAHICSSGENCDTMACTAWNSSYNSEANNISMDNAFGNTPIEVSNLTLTPGDKSISVSWGDVNQTTSIWAYGIRLDRDATRIVSGARKKNTMTISNLTNGTAYTVSVQAISFDGYPGIWTSKPATPVAPPCTQPSCTMTIV